MGAMRAQKMVLHPELCLKWLNDKINFNIIAYLHDYVTRKEYTPIYGIT